jgi:hypothetical protein
MKLCFVSVNGPRETYFVDEPRSFLRLEQAGMRAASMVYKAHGLSLYRLVRKVTKCTHHRSLQKFSEFGEPQIQIECHRTLGTFLPSSRLFYLQFVSKNRERCTGLVRWTNVPKGRNGAYNPKFSSIWTTVYRRSLRHYTEL